MSTYSGGWSTQQLAEFLTAIASYSDRPSALTGAVERVAEALEAEVAAVILGDDVLAAVGFPADDVPTALLCAAAAQGLATTELPSLGVCRISVVALETPKDARLLVARTGDSDFIPEEAGPLRGQGPGLAQTIPLRGGRQAGPHVRARSET